MERLITRTIKTKLAHGKAYNLANNSIEGFEKTIPEKVETIEKATAYLRKYSETDSYKIISVDNIELKSGLYGMTEDKFLENSIRLPDRKLNK